MNTQHTHPLVISAAIAVIVTCGVAIGSMAGLFPASRAENQQTQYQSQRELPRSSQQEQNSAYAPPASTLNANPPARVVRVSSQCHNCGRVVAVRPIKIQGQASGLGAVAGGLTGALVGKQFGNGKGQTAMTVAGAVGGAALGHNLEKNHRSKTVYDVSVRFEDGGTSTYRYNSARWHVGERVRVVNGRLQGRA